MTRYAKNTAMLQMCRALGFTIRADASGDVISPSRRSFLATSPRETAITEPATATPR